MIFVENVQLVKKIMSLTFLSDQSVELVIVTGVIGADTVFVPMNSQSIRLGSELVVPLLSESVVADKSRKDDISDAIYSLLLSQNILTGTIV